MPERGSGRDETEEQRLDRNLGELLQELRIAVPGIQVLLAFLLAVPIVLGVMVGIWMMRSEAFARRVGAFATRATDSVMRRMHRPAPGDLTDRLLTFREAARDLLLARIVPITLTQLLAQSVGYVTLLLSMRAVGVGSDVLPAEVILAGYDYPGNFLSIHAVGS